MISFEHDSEPLEAPQYPVDVYAGALIIDGRRWPGLVATKDDWIKVLVPFENGWELGVQWVGDDPHFINVSVYPNSMSETGGARPVLFRRPNGVYLESMVTIEPNLRTALDSIKDWPSPTSTPVYIEIDYEEEYDGDWR